MNDYHIGRDVQKPLKRRVDEATPVIFQGTIPQPESHFDAGTGSWVVFDRYLELSMSSTFEVKRTWWRASRFAYEPSTLGLTVAVNPSPGVARQPSWNDYTCVIRPEHESDFRSEYPRRVRSY